MFAFCSYSCNPGLSSLAVHLLSQLHELGLAAACLSARGPFWGKALRPPQAVRQIRPCGRCPVWEFRRVPLGCPTGRSALVRWSHVLLLDHAADAVVLSPDGRSMLRAASPRVNRLAITFGFGYPQLFGICSMRFRASPLDFRRRGATCWARSGTGGAAAAEHSWLTTNISPFAARASTI